MTSKGKRKRSASEDDPDLQKLNARLDRIYSTINPIIPYQLKINRHTPFKYSTETSFEVFRRVWTKGTPFPHEEGLLQYLSNFREWPSSLIQAVGDWDDGKGGIARKQISPATQSATATPQQAAKRIKFGDYTAKKASDQAPKNSVPVKAELQEQSMSTKDESTGGRQANGLEVKAVAPKKRPRDANDSLSKIKGAAVPVEKKPRNSPLVEDTKPTLPPPMTPLPQNLRDALAEYRQQMESTSEEQHGSEKGPAAYNISQKEPETKKVEPVVKSESKSVPQRQRKPGETEKTQADQPTVKDQSKPKAETRDHQKVPEVQPSKESLVIKLHFRKRRVDFARLLKMPPRPHSHSNVARTDVRDQASHTPTPSSRAAKQPTPRVVSPVVNRTAGKSVQSSAFGAELEKSWNKVAIDLKKGSEDESLRQSKPREAFVLFLTSVLAFMIQANLKTRYMGPAANETQIIWDGTAGVIRKFRRSQFNPSGCELMEGLMAYLEAVVCREQALCRKDEGESYERWKGMANCLERSARLMNPVGLQQNFPRTWAGQTSSADDDSGEEQMLKKPLRGRYTLTSGLGTALESVRAARLLIIEWCEKHNVKYDDGLARLGGA